MEGVGKLPSWWSAVVHYQVKDPATGELKDKVKNNNKYYTENLNDTYHVYVSSPSLSFRSVR